MKNTEYGSDDTVMREPLRRATRLVVTIVASTVAVPLLAAATPAAVSADATGGDSAVPVVQPTVAVTPEITSDPPPPPADVAYDVWYDRWGQSVVDVPVGADPWGTWDLEGELEAPVDSADQYAMRMRTLLTPHESGTYRFAVSGDDDARLFLNPAGDDPIGARQVAYVAGWTTYRQFDRFASQRSDWFELTAGQPYYVEVIGKEGSFGDHFSVAWEQRDGFGLTMVPGDVLETTQLGSGGWRSATPSGLPSAPSPMVDPGWQSVEGVESLSVSWNPVDGAEWYEVRLEGSGEAREVVVDEPSVAFDDLVPETRYVVEVAPANAAARMPVASTVRVTLPGPYPAPVPPVAGDRPSVSYDRWDTGWWTLTSVPFGAVPASSGTSTFGFESIPMQGDHHAARLRAVVTPTVTGDYTFFLSADDDARLFLNPDGVDAKRARQIAYVAGWTEQYQWDRYQSQRSATFRLEAGRGYYLEAISVHALGLDHLEVGWSRDGSAIEVIPNDVLTPTPAGAGGWRTDPSSLPHPPGTPDVDAGGGVHDVVVGWAAPETDEHHGAATFYHVILTGAGVSEERLVAETTVTFDGLPTDAAYTVTVTAWNDAGPGTPAQVDAHTSDRDEGEPGSGGPVPSTGRYALLATGTSSSCQGIEMSGSALSIVGDLRTNGKVGLYVGALTVDGTLSYGVALQPGSQQAGTVVHEPDPVAADLPFDLDALLGGTVPAGIDVHRHHRNVVLGSDPAKGIHLVDGNVTVSGSGVDLQGVTVVATGTINVSGSSMTASPAAPGLPSLATTSSSCGKAAINVSSSASTWSGAIVAPNGLVRFSGSQVTGRGSVIGAAVRASGASLSFGQRHESRLPIAPAAAEPADAPLTAQPSPNLPEGAPTVPAAAPAAAPAAPAPAPVGRGSDVPRPTYCPVTFPDLGGSCLR